VDDSLRGQGAARKLLDTAVAWARETQTQVKATCPYAKAQFEKDPSIRDVLAPKPV
jgi:predicted GNAT family acetyltransferase